MIDALIKDIETLFLDKAKVVFACKTGSALFCGKCRDNDIIVVLDKYEASSIGRAKIDGYDVFIYSIDTFEKLAKASFGNYRNLYSIAVALSAKSDNTLYGSNPLTDYNWFDYAENTLPWVKHIDLVGHPDFAPRNYVWNYAIAVALSQNSLDFSEETKAKLQAIHDGEMPTADLQNEILGMLEVEQ